MTLITASTEAAVVDIFHVVAGVADSAHYLWQRLLVTVGACDLAVSAIKRESGAAVVIKRPDCPASRYVAGFALFTERLLVDIVFPVTTQARFRRLAIAGRLVTVLTLRDAMPTGQRKLRFVVIKARRLPRHISVARCAVFAELTFVRIIFAVTRNTTGFEFLAVDRTGVALAAGKWLMFSSKRELRQLVVIKACLLPVLRVVAGFTTIPVVAFVRIVLLVTTDTRRCDIPVQIRLCMAGHAPRTTMFVQQGKLGACVVKNRNAPGFFRRMTGLAVRTERTSVPVICFVASDTGRRCVFEIRCLGVTGFAFGIYMLAIQFESSGGMIEACLHPLALSMAIGALRSQSSLVLVVGFVTCKAKRRQFDSCRWCHMAALTLRTTMLAAEHVFGISVVVEIGLPDIYAVTGLTAVA